MGDFCFDPQIGLYKPGEKDLERPEEIDSSAYTETQEFAQIEHATSLDRQAIKCDGSSMFDIFCGKAKKNVKPKHKLEVWIDVSQTMKQVDYAGEGVGKMCQRQSFLEVLDLSCPLHKDYDVKMFNESLIQMGMKDQTCLNHGLNNYKRLLQKIQASTVPHLIIITDIFEAFEEFINYVEAANGKVRGIEKPLYAKDLKGLVKVAASYCK